MSFAVFLGIAAVFANHPGVTLGGMMGSNALMAGGKIFAMRTKDGKLVYKLPAVRVEALIAANEARAWGPGTGRVMKEWAELVEGKAEVIALADEAKVFVAKGKS